MEYIQPEIEVLDCLMDRVIMSSTEDGLPDWQYDDEENLF